MKTTWTRALSGTSTPPILHFERKPRSTSSHRYGAILALLVIVLSNGAAGGEELKSGVFKPTRAAPDFSLEGSNGADVTLSRFRGKVVALGFGYTSCPDVCPTTLAYLAEARKALGKAGKEFQVIYVTVDPERDSAQRLRKYMDAFDPSFIGATGSSTELANVRKAYGITMTKNVSPDNPSAYSIHHSSFVYLIDRAGNLRAMVPFGASVDDIASDVRTLLKG